MSEWRDTPKVELHLHLEGAAPPAFIKRLADEKKINLSGVFNEDGSYKWADFAAFLRAYEASCTVLTGPEEYHRLIQEVLAAQAEHGVIYTEHFLAPEFMGGGDPVAWDEYLAAVGEGAQAAEAAHGITARFINTCVRHEGPEQARRVADLTAKTMGPMLTGFGMGGEERYLMPADFALAFAAAHEAGLGITSHAGEICGADQVTATLDALPVSRIGHGVRAVEDGAVCERLVEMDITLEVNPGSNVALSVVPDWGAHPIEILRARGVKVTVSTDDPPYFRTDMTREYEMLARHFDWDAVRFAEVNRWAMDAAFCDDATRQAILARF